jgi:hypothetical protein
MPKKRFSSEEIIHKLRVLNYRFFRTVETF